MKIIHTNDAPEAVGPYSQAVVSNGFVFLSGQIGLDPQSGQLVTGGVLSEARQIFANIEAVLQAAHSGKDHVVKTTIFLMDINHFSEINTLYSEYFEAHRPARSTIEVARLPKKAMIEIECVARVG